MTKITKDMIKELYEAIIALDNVEECEKFFEDLCTYQEIEKMAQRIIAAKMLHDGKTYAQVISVTDISSATLSRVSRSLQYGEGYKKLFDKE